MKRMTDRFRRFVNDIVKLEPKVGSINEGQMMYIMNLIKTTPTIRHVLETGFHTGVSAATFMDMRDDVDVVSFDIFWFDYTRKAKLLLDKYYGNRNLLIAGNTIGSLKKYLEQTKTEFDLVFIDGGHEWPVPYYDLQEILSMVKEDTIVLIDDYCEAHGKQGVIRAVDEIIKMGLLKDIQVLNSHDRGMIIAKRSSLPYKSQIPHEEVERLLGDISSHYGN